MSTNSTNGRAQNNEPNVATSFAGLTHDVIELAELQAQLLAVDVKSTSQQARVALALGAAGVAVLLGTIPIALIAIAESLIQQLGWPNAGGYAAASAIGLLISVGILIAAWSQFRSGVVTMQRSHEEFKRNIAWVKSSLRNRTQDSPVDNN